jgi:cardiolipin synthase
MQPCCVSSRIFWVGFITALSLFGCASVPDVDDVGIEQQVGTPQIVGAHGPLTAAQSRTILARLEQQSQGSDLLERHLAIEQAVAGAPLVAGNHTTLLHDGPETFRAMFKAMGAAKKSIYLEYYIFENVESDDQYLAELLIAKRQEGVAIGVIYDSYGSIDTPREFFDRLKAVGIELLEFHPVNSLEGVFTLNDRDHRKILVVDGITAIVGGVNLYTAYQAHPHARFVASDGADTDTWHDTDLEIDGPAAAPLQQLFLDHWAASGGSALPSVDLPTPAPAVGNEVVRIIGSDHDDTIPRYYATLLSAIRNADKTIWLTTAYFVPTGEELRDLKAAARRGVDVRLLVPGKSDSSLALAASHSTYGGLLKAGVKIFALHDGMLHSKTVVIDGVWSAIGSSNFDHRSILFNDEVDAIVLGRDTAQQLEAMFQKSADTLAKPVSIDAWEGRSLTERIRELYSRALIDLL